MYIKTEVEGFYWLMNNCWSGAIDTLKVIEEYGEEEALMDYLESMFDDSYNMPTLTELNDFLWFEDELIFCELGINLDDEEEWEDIDEEEDDYDEQWEDGEENE